MVSDSQVCLADGNRAVEQVRPPGAQWAPEVGGEMYGVPFTRTPFAAVRIFGEVVHIVVASAFPLRFRNGLAVMLTMKLRDRAVHSAWLSTI